MIADCADEENSNRTPGTRVARILSTGRVGETTTISSSGSTLSSSAPVCKYILNKQTCPFGSRCRFRHPQPSSSSSSSPPICRLFLASRCRYGDRCKFRHPEQQRAADNSSNPNVGSLTSFPSLGSGGVVSKKQSLPVPSHQPRQPSSQRRSRQSRDGPPELNLEAFFQRAASINPRPHVQRPQPHHHGNSPKELCEVEFEQLEARFPSPHSQLLHKGPDKTIYSISYSPTDPEWTYEFKTLEVTVTFPSAYPQEPLHMELTDPILSLCCLECVNVPMKEKVQEMFHNSQLSGQCTLMFRPLLNWLDSHITGMMESCQCRVDDDEERTEEEEGEKGDFVSSGSDDDSEGDCEDSKRQSGWSKPLKRGTEVRLQGMTMSESVATLQFSRVKLTLQCTRCKHVLDTICSQKQVAEDCPHCHLCFSATFHPDLVHAANPTVGFLDLHGCQPVDAVLPSSECLLVCLECGRENTVHGLSFGQPWTSWCHGCHIKLCVGVEQVKFLAHQLQEAGSVTAEERRSVTKRKKKDPRIQEGMPLPDTGTCDHYRKSHRWLRFPCCGKAYPCDVCHDTVEDHVMEQANRMICGYCSKEQPYSGDKPCVMCGTNMAFTARTSYWEGGQGCRNKSKMSRNDRHKYASSSSKTACRKSERVGSKGKANRESN